MYKMQEDGLQNDGGHAPAENSKEHRHGVEAKVRAAVFLPSFLPSPPLPLRALAKNGQPTAQLIYSIYKGQKTYGVSLVYARVRESTLHDGCCSRYAKKNHAEHVHIEQSFI